MATSTDFNNQELRNTYDAAGRLDTVAGPYEVPENLITIDFEYHPEAGHPYAVTRHVDREADGAVRTDTIDDHNNATRASYDNFGRRTVVDNPDSGRTETGYDLAGNRITKSVLPSGVVAQGHEQGHYFQNLLLGPLYLPVVAIPSLISAAVSSSQGAHEKFYTESWASAWGK